MSSGESTPRDNQGMRKFARRALGVGVLAAAGYAVWRAFEQRPANPDGSGAGWQAQPFPYPPQPRVPPVSPVPPVSSDPNRWVESIDGTCPTSHPVKAKLASGIFHEPGGASYERTKADRCYASVDAATADDLRPAKR
jgi:hypothetical protein